MGSFVLIAEKVERGERISLEDLVTLYQEEDLFAIGELADLFQKKINGTQISYNLVYAFGLPEIFFLQPENAYFSNREHFPQKRSFSEHLFSLEKAIKHGVSEVYIGRDIFYEKKFEFYLKVFRKLKSNFPNLFVRAFNAVEIDFFVKETGFPLSDVLASFKEAGLDGLADVNTQIFSVYKKKLITQDFKLKDFLLIHELAHKVGLTSSLSLPYSHTGEEKSYFEFIQSIRDLQDRTGGVSSLTPYPTSFSILQNEVREIPSASEDLRFIALSRLFLDNIKTIRANWTIYGPDLAQVATTFGAGAIGSVWVNESGDQDFFVTRQRLRDLIFRARKTPTEEKSLEENFFENKKEPNEKIYDILPTAKDYDFFLEASIHFAKNSDFFDLVKDNNLTVLSSSKEMGFGVSVDKTLEGDFEEYCQVLLKAKREYSLVFCRFDLSSYSEDENEIDLTEHWEKLLFQLETLKKNFPDLQVVLSGFLFLWKVAQVRKKVLREIFTELLSFHVNMIESSSQEFEGALTNSEIVALHKQAHLAGLSTTAKLELNACVDGRGFLWKVFLSKLNSYIILQKETLGIKALKLEPSFDSPMSMSEFLYAVSLTKYFLVAGNVTSVLMVPLKNLPVLNSEACLLREIQLKKQSFPSFAQRQFISLLLLLGVQDLGAFDYSELSEKFQKKISLGPPSSCCFLKLRDAAFILTAENLFSPRVGLTSSTEMSP